MSAEMWALSGAAAGVRAVAIAGGGLVIAGGALAGGAIVGGVIAGGAAHGLLVPQSRLFGPVISRGESSGPPRIALTFDDGPHPDATPRILDLLRELNVHAAFFVIGQHACRMPALVQRMQEEGHVIGNHTFAHERLGAFRHGPYWNRELARANQTIESIIGERPALFRPPMGFKTPHIMKAARAQELHVVTWSRRAYDGVRSSPERIAVRLGRSVRAGDIILLHDGNERARPRDVAGFIELLRSLIGGWRSAGIEPVRLDALIGLAPL